MNIERSDPGLARGEPVLPTYDRRATFFVEAGGEKALLLDPTHATGPLPRGRPSPLGPSRRLEEIRPDHGGNAVAAWTHRALCLHGRLPERLPGARQLKTT